MGLILKSTAIPVKSALVMVHFSSARGFSGAFLGHSMVFLYFFVQGSLFSCFYVFFSLGFECGRRLHSNSTNPIPHPIGF